MHDKQRQTIENRIERNKAKVVEILEKSPVIQIACDRANISRATFFRWKSEDTEFANKVDEALSDGKGFISDMAIAQLIRAVKEGNPTMIKFWLTKHHIDYRDKLDITAEVTHNAPIFTPEQEKIIRDSLEVLSKANLVNQNHEPRNTPDHRDDEKGSEHS
jgi:hypothetical protein